MKLIALLILSAFLFATCTKKWEDHNALTSASLGNNLYVSISKTANLTRFTELLVRSGYDKVLAGSKSYTVWAPTDQALATLDNATFVDSGKLRQFVANHIAYENYLVDNSAQRIGMMNGKYMNVTGTKFDSANIITQNLYASNGIYHIIDKFIPRTDNCWEFMTNSTAAPLMKTYLLSQDYNYFDPTKATQTGVNSSGLPVYDTATGLSKRNHYLEDVLDVSDEKGQYTFILMNDASFTTEYNKLTPWFKTGTADSTNKLSSGWLTKDLAFKGAYTAAQLLDTMISVSGVKVPIVKTAITASYKTSNGWVHVMNQVNFNPVYKFPPIIIEGENPTSFVADRTANTLYRVSSNPSTGLSFKDILMQNYNYANYYITYIARNLNSMRYNAFWVAVNDVQTTPLWQQRLAIDSTTNTASLPFVTVAYKNYSEVALGQISLTNFRDMKLFVMGPTTASSSGGNNSISLDYIKLVPAF